VAVLAGMVAAVAGGLVPGIPQLRDLIAARAAPQALAPQDGRLVIESEPGKAPVEIDGVAHGTTPIKVNLKAGRHLVRVGTGAATREIRVNVAAGAEVIHHVELPVSVTRLRIETVPAAMPVMIDGQPRGLSPLDLTDLSPGSHALLVGYGDNVVRRQVEVQPGVANSVVITLGGAPAGPVSGWITVTSPIDLDVYEGTRLVGRSRDDRMLLLAGPHDLAFVNRELGVDDRRRVEVGAGRVARVSVQPAKGLLNVNAVPWAEVFLDGTRIGETPIANFATSLGTHELVLRHPDLGEQKRTVTVSLQAPVRVGVTFKQ